MQEITHNEKDKMNMLTGVTAGIISALSLCIFVLIVLNYFNIFHTSHSLPFLPHQLSSMRQQKPPTQPSSLQQKNIINSINICTTQQASYPQVTDILTTKTNPNLGEYQGIVNKVTVAEQSLTISSIPNGTIFVFHSNTNLANIYDYHHNLVTNIATIPTGAKIIVYFPCLQQNNTFTISQIQQVK